jgi:hypothetical protein
MQGGGAVVYKEQTYSRLYGGLEAQHEVDLSKDKTTENILDRLSDLETYPDKIPSPL